MVEYCNNVGRRAPVGEGIILIVADWPEVQAQLCDSGAVWTSLCSVVFYSAWVWRVSRLRRDGTAKPVSRDQVHRRERAQEYFFFLFS